MVDTLSPELQASMSSLWQALDALPAEQAAPARRALGLWCVALEPLPLSTVARRIDCSALGADGLTAATRPFLSPTPATPPDGEALLGPSSEAIRAFIVDKIGSDEVAAQHRCLGAWPPARRGERAYVLKHGIHHRIQAGDWQEVELLAFDPDYLVAQCREASVGTAQAGVALARDALGTRAAAKLAADLATTTDPAKQTQLLHDFTQGTGDKLGLPWKALSNTLLLEEARLTASPIALPSLLFNSLRRQGLTRREITRLTRLPPGRPRLRLAYPLQNVQQSRDLGEAPAAGHAVAVTACAMTADGKRAVSASIDTTLKVWNLETGTLLFTLEGHTAPLISAAIAPDGRLVVSGAEDGTVRVWELPEPPTAQAIVSRVVSRNEDDPVIFGVALTPDRQSVLFGTRGRESRFGSLRRQSLKAEPDALASYLWQSDVSMTKEDEAAVLASLAENDRAAAALGNPTTTPEAMNELLAALAANEQSDRDMEAKHGQIGPSAFAVTPDGRALIGGLDDGSLFVQDLTDQDAEASFSLGIHQGRVTACAVTPDGRRLVTASADCTLSVWDLSTRERIISLTGHPTSVTGCAITPDGERLVSSGDDELRIWDLATYSCLEVCPGAFSVQGLAVGKGRVCAGDLLGNVAMYDVSEPVAPGTGTVQVTGPVERCQAVLVGVSFYEDTDLHTLPFSGNDVRALGQVLEDRGYDVLRLHDATDRSFLLPMRRNILTELALLHLDPDDLLVVYFACHGVREGGKMLLLTSECDSKRLSETGLPLSDVIATMAATGARRQVLLLDACYAGVGLFGRDGNSPGEGMSDVDPGTTEAPDDAPAPRTSGVPRADLADARYVRETFDLAEGFALLAASTAQEKSNDLGSRSHALFTSAVIEGLAGAADRDGKGFVTVDDLRKHVVAAVAAGVDRETHLPQSATARIACRGDMVLTRVLPGQGPCITTT